MAKTHWVGDWKVGVRVWVEREGLAVLGEGRAELLAAIDSERSITKAAKEAGMSYRRAWNLIQEVNGAAGETLVESAVGGRTGGGARLTDRGQMALAIYKELRHSLVESSAGALQRALCPKDESGACIHVAAAVSLQEAVNQILAEYALQHPTIRVRAIFGASNELADHLLAGAPGDLFISAEPSHLDRLETANLLDRGTKRDVAQNGLAIVGSTKSSSIEKTGDLLSRRFGRVAVAEPACPLGQYSRDYLQRARVYDDLLPRILQVDSSRAVLAAVVSGAAAAGVAFASDAASVGAWRTLFRVPTSQVATTYSAALIRRGKMPTEAKSLLEFLASGAAARCLRRCGLKPVAKPSQKTRRTSRSTKAGKVPL